jgi:beta-lactamase regulating signal transducer with metallopeptidase domain
MTFIPAIPASSNLLAQLANSAIRALAMGGAAGLGLAAFRVKNTSTRLLTWTLVLYAALAMPVLKWILPTVSVPFPAVLQYGRAQDSSETGRVPLQRDEAMPIEGPRTSSAAASSAQMDHRTAPRNEIPALAPTPEAPRALLSTVPWSMIAAATYFSIALMLFVRFFVGLAFTRRLALASQEIAEPRLALRMASRAYALRLASIPRTAESEFVSVPLTMGVLRSTIVLPTDWREWDDTKLDAVVAHELSHVARRDALTQRLSLLHRAIFWFSPLSWWLNRHLANLAEEASDEAALTGGADRKDYAKTLLDFFEALHDAPGRVWWQGVAMAKAGQAERRLERILSWKGSVAMHLNKSIAVALFALAVPVVYLAASVHAGTAQDQTAPAASTREVTPPLHPSALAEPTPAPEATAATVDESVSTNPTFLPAPVAAAVPTSPVAPVPPTARIAAVAPLAPVAPVPPVAKGGQSGSSNGNGYSYAYGYDDEQRFVIVSGKSDSLTMSGSTEDARHVEKLRKQIPGDFIWFQRDEKSYIIRDQATINSARNLWAPQEEIGKKQEALGKQQEALGKQQEELGVRMEQIHVNVPDMTAELDKLKAELKQLNSSATVEQMGHIQSEIGELQSKIGDVQSHAGDQQGKLGEEMGALGEKQGKLGEEQGELGRQQAELAQEASRKMKQLLDDAIAKGLAQLEL